MVTKGVYHQIISSAFLGNFVMVVLGVFLTGCTFNQAAGPQFTPVAISNPSLALIYVYRPADNQGGYNKSYEVTANNVKLPNIKFNGYYSHEINAGPVHLTASPCIENGGLMILDQAIDVATANQAKLDLDVMAGQIYYVKFHREVSMWGAKDPELLLISNEVGQREISGCKLSEP